MKTSVIFNKIAVSIVVLFVISACAIFGADADSTKDTAEKIPSEIKDSEKYLVEESWRIGKFLAIDGEFVELTHSSVDRGLNPLSDAVFSETRQPIISIRREYDSRSPIDTGIPVQIFDHYGEIQQSTTLFDDGVRVAVQPIDPLKDGVYFVIDDHTASVGQNLHVLDCFYIWQDKKEEIIQNFTKFLNDFQVEMISNPNDRYYFDSGGLKAWTAVPSPSDERWSEEIINSFPVLTDSTIAFITPIWDGRGAGEPVRFSQTLGIDLSDDCRIESISEYAKEKGFQINDILFRVNDVQLFTRDSRWACEALVDFIKLQSPNKPFDITVIRNSDEKVVLNITHSYQRENDGLIGYQVYPLHFVEIPVDNLDYFESQMNIKVKSISFHQPIMPLVDGFYCTYENVMGTYSTKNYFCFWKE